MHCGLLLICVLPAQIRKNAQKKGLDLKFYSRRDHLDPCLRNYKVGAAITKPAQAVNVTSAVAASTHLGRVVARHVSRALALRLHSSAQRHLF